jgi:hypothetical protein
MVYEPKPRSSVLVARRGQATGRGQKVSSHTKSAVCHPHTPQNAKYRAIVKCLDLGRVE